VDALTAAATTAGAATAPRATTLQEERA